ncbi:MAG: chemotaxis protein CheC [Halobacteriales archaeon]
MRLDVNTLGTFHEMAREGAGAAARRLSKMTDVTATVDVTKVNFMSESDIRSEFADGGYVGVKVKLAGGPGGQSIVVFDEQSVASIVETLVPDGGSSGEGLSDMDRSAITELGHILNNGFIDGWADVLETAIDISTPEYVRGETAEAVLGDLDQLMERAELALMFQSHIQATGEEIAFNHYLLPDHDAMDDALSKVTARPLDQGFDYEKLTAFDRMVDQGADEVANSVTQMTGFDAAVDIRRINFVPVETIPRDVSEKRQVGVAFTFDGLPSGYLVFLFDEESAEEIVEALLPSSPEEALGAMGESAIKELGNIMASGFLDGWANVLDTAIDMSTPNYIRDMGSALVDPIAIEIAEDQEYAFVFDTVIVARDREFDTVIMAIPEEGDLERALDALEMDAIGKEPETPSFPIDEV